MSLRLRAVLIVGVALALLWSLAALWMVREVHVNLDRTLDQRLAMSAQMVSGLLQRSALLPDSDAGRLADAVSVGGGQGIACQIRSLRGEILAATGDDALAALDMPRPGFAAQQVDGARWRTFTLHVDDYVITTADRVDERDLLVRGIVIAAGVPVLIAALGGLLALWVGIGRGLAPLDTLRRTLQARDADATAPIDLAHAPAELRPLVGALNGLVARLSGALQQQRAFTDSAAHELRTPLTAIDTHLQLARLQHGAPAEIALERAGQGVQRLRRTLDQLLALARADVPTAVDDACGSVREAIETIVGRLPDEARARVSLQVVGDDRPSPVPQSMLDTAVRNLVDNALRHAPASPVRIDVVFDDDARRCRIAVADRGPGLSEAQLALAGSRFWRGDQGRRHGDGAGLGISIVRAIAARHGGALCMRARDGGGLVAELTVPTG